MHNQWLNEMERQISARTAHTFLLHGNVVDDVLFRDKFLRLYEVVPCMDALRHAGVIAFFNFATGVRFPESQMRKVFIQLIIKPIFDRLPEFEKVQYGSPERYFESKKEDLEEVIRWFDKLLVTSWNDALEQAREDANLDADAGSKLLELLKDKQPKEGEEHPFAMVVLEYLESKTPPDSATGSSRLDRKVVETFQWWAQLKEIQRARNLIVFVSDFLATVASQLHEQSKGVIPIMISLPDREEQKETIEAFVKEGIYTPVEKEGGGDLDIGELARIAAGLSRVELRQIFVQAKAHDSRERLTSALLFEKKARIIEGRLGDVVRVKKPPWGWEVIGGMADKVALAAMWIDAMQRGNIARMPKGGILLSGAPGTGKTVFAEAAAHELDAPFLEVMNTFNQFVGVSEQNMQNLIDTAWAMRPCILFFDEIEQLLLPRGEVYHGDSGVFARSSRMLMQFFSDPRIHGQVVIFAATNRPDLLDTAMKRAGRFGAKIPFLIPTAEDRPSIWKALLRKEVIRLSLSGIELDISQVINNETLIAELSEMADFWEYKGQLVCGPPDRGRMLGEETIPMTGAEMEDIIGLALQPFLHDEDRGSFQGMTQDERIAFLRERFPQEDRFVLTGDMLKDAMRNYLPHEDVYRYRAMNDLALLSVNDLRFIPPAYRERARKLRTDSKTIRN